MRLAAIALASCAALPSQPCGSVTLDDCDIYLCRLAGELRVVSESCREVDEPYIPASILDPSNPNATQGFRSLKPGDHLAVPGQRMLGYP